MASHRWSSVNMNRMLGGRVGGRCVGADNWQQSEENQEQRANTAQGAGRSRRASAVDAVGCRVH